MRYLTPHSKWSIHSEYQDNLFMLSLSRGGPTIWMSPQDADKVGVADNDWIEAVNRNGVVVARAIVSYRMPEGTVYMYHAQERVIDVPIAETSGKRGGIHNSLTRLLIKPTHLTGGYAQLAYAFNYLGPTGNQRDEVTDDPPPQPGGGVLMRVMAQMAMVMNLDKCIGCHTCSVTCKQAWTNRTGVEYVWFNNVETRPGQGYPRTYQDQERWKGGWTLEPARPADARAGGRLQEAANIFSNPLMPSIDDYYEPWTYDYENLTTAPAQRAQPGRPAQVAADRGKDMKVAVVGELGRRPRRRPGAHRRRPGAARRSATKIRLEFEQTFMFYLPRICEHCLNPACAASCPSGAIYKRTEDGIVLVDQDRCRGWRMCVTGCPYKKVYFNHRTGKAEKCTFCFPRVEVGIPTVCSETCVGRLRYIGVVLYDADRVLEAASAPGRAATSTRAQRAVFLDPDDPEVQRGRGGGRHPARLGRGRAALAGVGADQPLRGGAAAAPGVPHDADGLVHPAAVAGRRRAHATTGHDGEDAGNLFGAIDALRIPIELPGRAVHRRRPATGPRRAGPARRDARRSCATSTSAASPTSSIADAVGMTPRGHRGHVPAARRGQVRRALRHPDRARRSRRPDGARARLEELAAECSLDYDGGPGMGGSGPFGEISGGAAPVAVENFHMLRQRQTSDTFVDPGDAHGGSTCSTGTARARQGPVPAARGRAARRARCGRRRCRPAVERRP